MNALELQNVFLRRGSFILRDICLTIQEGDTVALVGETGSGKSTLIAVIGNAVQADAGKIFYCGRELCEDEAGIRKSLAVMYETPNFNVEMKAGRLANEIRRFEPWFDMEFFHRGMEFLELDETERIKLYSRRMKKKYMLLLALSRTPSLLLMDDPFGGTDEKGREKMWTLIGNYREQKTLTVFFSTQDQTYAGKKADRVIGIKDGEIQ